ncbi:MAG: 1-deoxy-D-xylulose-5-phosphate synthase [Oscillospiraceae bacterium]
MGSILDTINSPTDVKKLNNEQLKLLCSEIRASLIDSVSKTGGHLASNLGVVEISVAFHRCFDCPRDSIVFDVGHQCYTHKMLTGRKGSFDRLRKKGGPAGFPKPSESDCDSFIAGHSGTSISSAIGLARAKLLCGDNSKTVVLIGDGSMVNGMAYEAINSLDSTLKNLIVILNDNEMSISKSVGSIAEYLLYLRTDYKYSTFKRRIQDSLEKLPYVGTWIMGQLLRSKSAIRRAVYNNGTLFEELGFNYVGPVDGHNIDDLCRIFENVKQMNGPILIHAITVKGKGFALAEENPGAYHGVGKFDLELGNPDISYADSFSNRFGKKLCQLGESNSRICAVTAAMKYGTGLQYFAKLFPERFFDVGIAEEHAVTFCGGLARGGMKPVFSVYSTFLQRAFDQMFHDITLIGADVMIAIDRAGLVGDDGETHQGIFDAALMSALPSFTVASPSNYSELEDWMERLMKLNSPTAIRYPRGSDNAAISDYASTGNSFDLIVNRPNSNALFVTYGREFAQVLGANQVTDIEYNADILKLNIISPIDSDAIKAALSYNKIIFVEEGVQSGGIGEHFLRMLNECGFKGTYRHIAIANPIVTHASVSEQLCSLGLDSESLKKVLLEG